MAVAYQPFEPIEQSKQAARPVSLLPNARPNGSLYSRQKRSIADACEWLRLTQTKDKKALIFVLTSPGYTSLANQPYFLSGWIDNMKKNYGLGDYVWVREMTKRGFPHFHFVAHWHPAKWFLDLRQDAPGFYQYRNVSVISQYWSGLFGSDAKNSFRIGTYKGNKRTGYYLTTERHAWYLTKYLGKSINDKHSNYLCEAGYPSTNYKKAVRGFGMSENVALLSQPDLFESQNLFTSHQASVQTTRGLESVTIDKFDQRVFIGESGQLSERDLQTYNWKWTGHGETFLGFRKDRPKRSRSGQLTLEKGQ